MGEDGEVEEEECGMRWGMKNVRIIIGRLKYGWGWSLELLGRVSGWYSGKIKGWVGYWRE